MSGGNSGRRSSSPSVSASTVDPPPLSFSSSPATMSTSDNPFLQQLDFMLGKSASKRAPSMFSSSSPSPTPTPLTVPSGGGKDARKEFRSETEGWRLSQSTVEVADATVDVAPSLAWRSNAPSLLSRSVVGGGGGRGSGVNVGGVARARNWEEVGAIEPHLSREGLPLLPSLPPPPTAKVAKVWSAAQPKKTNDDDTAKASLSHISQPQPRSFLFDMSNWDSSDEDDFGCSRALQQAVQRTATWSESAILSSKLLLSPVVAEAKPSVAPSVGGKHEGNARSGNSSGGSGDECDSERSAVSEGPSSDGGWPETKRCAPPNLMKASSRNGLRDMAKMAPCAAAGDRSTNVSGGYGDGNKNARASTLPRDKGTDASPNRQCKIAGGAELYGRAGRMTETGIPEKHVRSLSQEAAVDGVFPLRTKLGCCGSTVTSLLNGRSRFPVDSDDDWMSDAEDQSLPPPPAATASNETSAKIRKAGLKRGRGSSVRLVYGDGSSEGDSSSDSGGSRGRKAGRSERYPAPVPQRRLHSSSLSLTSPTSATFGKIDGDNDDNDDNGRKQNLSATTSLARAGGGGNKKGSSSGRRSLAGERSRDDQGRKRRHDDLLNDRIEAMSVGSDRECPSRDSGGRGKAYSQGGRCDPMGELILIKMRKILAVMTVKSTQGGQPIASTRRFGLVSLNLQGFFLFFFRLDQTDPIGESCFHFKTLFFLFF